MSIHNDACLTRQPNEIRSDFTRKRKRDEGATNDIDRRPFSIRSDSSDPFARPRTFNPLCLLTRSQLPLAYLDTSPDGSRLFLAHLHVLEACHDQDAAANVLIAEDEKESRLYAIERVQRHKYVLCRLLVFVNRGSLLSGTNNVRSNEAKRKRQALQSNEPGKAWWTSASVELDAASYVATVPPLRLDMGSAKSAHLPSADVAQTVSSANDTQVEKTVDMALDAESTTKSVSSEDALEELMKQYLDMLYLSRTSLAYFVKGPLTRARAAFISQPSDLIDFLRGGILTSAVTDKKYREGVAEVVKELAVLNTPDAKSKARKKRKWKPKRDRCGFFVTETNYIEQWWRKDDDSNPAPSSTISFESALRERTQKLRSRETFLQVILVLEALALEATTPSPTTMQANNESRNLETRAEESQLHTGEKKTRKKKAIDLDAVLEALLDRLCISYSISDSSPIKTRTNDENSEVHDIKDDLKSFGADVIIPFFASRIHERANAASKKLGGPSAPSLDPRKSFAPRKPGEPASRLPPERKSRRPLERISSNTFSPASRGPPALHRAATDQEVLASLIKRERSETPNLRSIPEARPQPQSRAKATSRKLTSLLDQHMGGRQIDLSAMSQANEAKIRKKAEYEKKIRSKEDQEQKIREAIAGIKKPNRSLATEEMARNADESFARHIAKARSFKSQPQRNTTNREAIAVTATPRHVKATPAHHARANGYPFERYDDSSRIVASSAKLLAQPGDMAIGSTPAVPQTGHRPRHMTVDDTPSRGFAKFMPPGLAQEPGTLIESPTASRSKAIASTPARSWRMPLAETPIEKPCAWVSRANDFGAAVEENDNHVAATAHDQYGWDDDYDRLG